MDHLAATNRRWKPERKHVRGTICAIASGSAGVGKTTLARNLAALLVQRGFRVRLELLRSTDPIGTSGRPHRLVSDVPRPDDGSPGFVVIDGPTGLDPALLEIAATVDCLILLTTTEPSVLADTYAVIKYLMQHGAPPRIGVVVTRIQSERAAVNTTRRLDRVTRHFLGRAVEYLGRIPADDSLGDDARDGSRVVQEHPRSTASLCLEAICERLGAAHRAARRPPRLWSRVAGIFL